MKLGLSLLDKASRVCGSDTELAKRLGVQRAFVSQMRGGHIKISPSTAAEMADIAGEDARQAAIDSLIENAKGTRREGVLREVLGKALAAGVAAMCLFSYSEGSIYAMENKATTNFLVNTLYIVEYVTRWFKSLMRQACRVSHGVTPIPRNHVYQ